MLNLRERSERRPAGSVAPPPRVAIALRALIERIGETAAVEQLGLSRGTLDRLTARLPCRRGTILLAAQALGINLDDDRVQL